MDINNVTLGHAVKFCTIVLNDLTYYDSDRAVIEIDYVINILHSVKDEIVNFSNNCNYENR